MAPTAAGMLRTVPKVRSGGAAAVVGVSAPETREPSMIEQPILLVGSERSGTTLLRLMLDSHPELAFGEEFEWAVEQIGQDGAWPDVDDYETYLETNRPFQTSGFTFDRSVTYPELINGFLDQRRRAKGVELVGATVHFGFDKALALWPKAKFIHMVRDPRDVAPSCVAMGWAGNVWFGMDNWIQAEDEWDRIAPRLADDQVLTVRFEELLADHEAVLAQICEFIGLDYTDRMLDYAKTTDYDVPQPGRSQGWRRSLDDRQVRLIEARAGDRLVERGYEPSGLGPLELTDNRHRLLKWQDRIGRIRFRIERFGLPLTVKEMAGRLLGRDDWWRSARREIMEIEKTHLVKSWSDGADGRSSR